MAVVLVPSHVNEATEPVDNLGGVLSVVLVGALILGDQLRARARTRPALILGLSRVALARAGRAS